MKRHSFLVAAILVACAILLVPAHPAGAVDLIVGSGGLTLTEDRIVEGNVNFTGGPLDVLDVKGFTLTVMGGVTVNGGTLYVNGGTLKITGNLDINGADGWLKMVEATDLVEVTGNVTFNGASSKDFLTAGILKVGGNFFQKGSSNTSTTGPRETNNRNSFTATGDHKVILNGAGLQDISFDASSDTDSHFQTLEISKNASTFATLFSDDGEAVSENFTPQGTWGIGTTVYEGQGAWSDSPAGNYTNNANSSLISNTLDLSAAKGVYLYFVHRYDVQSGWDYGKVEVSTNGGDSWTEIASPGYPSQGYTGTQNNWEVKLLDLSYYAGQASFQFRFRLTSDTVLTADGWQIDKIRLYAATGAPLRFTGNVHTAGQWTFGADSVIMPAYNSGALSFSGGSMALQGKSLAVPANLTVGGTGIQNGALAVIGDMAVTEGMSDLQGGVLTISGNVTLNKASMLLNVGTLTVGGNLTVTSDDPAKPAILEMGGGKCLVGKDLTVSGSYAYLKMTNVADVMEVIGKATFYGHGTYGPDAQPPYAYLSAGTFKVAGDFLQNGWGGSSVSFRASGTHKVILNGTAKQTVTFEYPNSSCFQNLEIANTSAEGVVFTAIIQAAGSFTHDPQMKKLVAPGIGDHGMTLDADLTLLGDQTITGPVNLAGHNLTISADAGTSGNVTLNKASMLLNSGTLTVAGNLTVQSDDPTKPAVLEMGGGKCLVGNDLTVGGADAYLKMTNAEDGVEVGRNAVFYGHSTYGMDGETPYAYLSAGTMKVAGDFSEYGYGGSSFSFRASGTHKVILNGIAKQTVTFHYPNSSCFQNLEIANTSAEGVVFTSIIQTAGSFTHDPQMKKLVTPGFGDLGLTLDADLTLFGDVTISGPVNLAGHNLTISADAGASGNLTLGKASMLLNGGILTVTGNLTVQSDDPAKPAVLDLGDGKCLVGKDLTVGDSHAYLKMTNTNGVAEVSRNATFYGHTTYGMDGETPYANLSAGTLKVAGDFLQYGWGGSSVSFRASGTHKVILNGTAKQTVTFEYPNSSCFQNLEITNISVAGIVFTSTIQVAGSFTHDPQMKKLVAPGFGDQGLTLFADLTLFGDVTISGPVNLAGHNLTISADAGTSGSATLNKASMLLNGGTLTVEGSLVVQSDDPAKPAILEMGGGKCLVGKDLTVSSSYAYLKMTNAEDVMEVGRSAAFYGHGTYGPDDPTPYAYLSAGTFKVAGDFSQHGWGGSSVSFRASGTHKVILNGTAKQTVAFEHPNLSCFQNLEISNISAEGVVFSSIIQAAGSFTHDPQMQKLTAPGIGDHGMTLDADLTLFGDVTITGPVNLAGHNLTISADANTSGNVTLNKASILLNGGTLTIAGNLAVQSDDNAKTAVLEMGGGKCLVGKDLTVSGASAYLKMTNAEDRVEVGRNADFYGRATYGTDGGTPYAFLSAGTLKVAGDFSQHGWGGSSVSFRASGTHKVIFNGTAKQTATFEHPNFSCFQNLEIANTSAEGVVFTPDKSVYALGEVTITSGTATGLDHPPRITSVPAAMTWFRDLPNLYQVTADDPDLLSPAFGEQLTFSTDQASTNKGVKITTDGIVYWTPAREQVGSHTITVSVTDRGGAQARQDLTITVLTPLLESDNNNTIATATPITAPNKMVKASLAVAGGTGADVDYYKITLAASRHIRVNLITLGSNKYVLDVLDSQGVTLGTIHLTGDSNRPVEQWVDLSLTTGTYYLRVQADPDQPSYNPDQIYGIGYQDLENYIPPEQTKTVVFGTAYEDVLSTAVDKRYYQFTLAQDGAVSIAFANPTLSYYRFLLKNALGSTLETFYLPAGLDFSGKVNLPAGAYTLTIESAGTVDSSQKFTLAFTASETDSAVENEANDTLQQANAVEVGKLVRGRISGDADTDFYRLSLSTTKMVDLVFKTAPSAAGHYNLDVLIGETVINHITIPGSGGTSTLSAGLYPGDYFLKVTGTGVSSADDYTIELKEMAGADREFEGNNTKAYANGLIPMATKQARLHSPEDIDFFGITFIDYGSFGLNIQPVTAGTDYNVKLYSAEDRLILDFTTLGGTKRYEEISLWPGNYYVKVTGAKEGDYTLLYEGEGSALKELVKLAIVEAPTRIEVGNATTLKLVGSYTDGTVIDLSLAQATWTSSDEVKATVSGNAVSGIAAGPVTIFANYGGQMAKAELDIGAPSVQKKQTYGNMILVAGGGAAVTNTLRDSTQYLANTTYNRFLGRGFRMEDIFYFNPIPWQDINGDGYGDPVVTEKAPTAAGLRSAIETWAVNQPSTGPLYLVMIDHGGIDTFEIVPGEIITAAQLDASLTAFERDTGRDVVVYIEACKSGSFVGDLAKTGSRRLVITSTNEGNAYLDLQGRVSFTQFFMDQLYGGNTFRQSYQNTVQKLANIGSPYSMMAPQLKEGVSNTLSLTRLGGNFAIAGLFPVIADPTPDMSILANTPQTFTANVDDLTGKTRVWAVVTPPDYLAPAVVGDLQAPQVALPTFDLTDEVNGEIDGIYTGTYNDFRYNGVYRVVFYARNADGLVVDSPPTLVTVTGGQNTLTITKTGPGGGTVTSDPEGIDCGTDCSETYSTATTLTLTAAPDDNSDFAGWSGTGIACPGTGSCTVLVNSAKSVNVDFARKLLKGDMNGDGAVNLADAILALKVIEGQNPVAIRSDYATSGVDVNGDNKIGLAEVIFILQKVAGVR